ncbi:phosphatase PAP2 family protein [Sphingopyxis indica]|uniref:PAP2 superfamily protein n=1 Tax=Sphingopyxis indica TaxID=436663 RepID=A0A239K4B9_9SPHN|nr:phosphatase PAP2 family protein [Sphingopyxis indica]SNT12638.1 PAP2 superfamily protein [Sphingopyxis indica]
MFDQPAFPIPSRSQPGPTKNKLSTKAVVICLALAATISAAALIYANILAQRYGLPPVRISESIGLGGLILIFSFPFWILRRLLHHYRSGQPNPAALIRDDILKNKFHFFMSLCIYVILFYAFASYTTIKVLIPSVMDFYFDIDARYLEYKIFGNDLVYYTHKFVGTYPTLAVEWFYSLWHVVNIYTAMWVIFSKNYVLKLRALITMLMSWIFLGSVMAIALSSVGPILFDHFYGGTAFAPLLDRLARLSEYGIGATMKARQFLLDNYGTLRLGSGISAMPSLHVGMAFLWFLMVPREYPGIRYLALAYFAVILFGSVHLGWHWLSDGIVSVVFVFGFWNLAGWIVQTANGNSSYARKSRAIAADRPG